MRGSFWSAILGFAIFAVANSASAAFINFVEGGGPVAVATNLVGPIVVVDPENATVSGTNTPAISTEPVIPGSRSAGLFEPGTSMTVVSDYVLFTAGPFDSGSQAISIEFHSGDILLADLIAANPGFPWGGGPEEDGTLQDISAFLGTFASEGVEGLYVRLQSPLDAAAAAPEPGTFVLAGIGLGLLGFAAWRHRRRV